MLNGFDSVIVTGVRAAAAGAGAASVDAEIERADVAVRPEAAVVDRVVARPAIDRVVVDVPEAPDAPDGPDDGEGAIITRGAVIVSIVGEPELECVDIMTLAPPLPPVLPPEVGVADGVSELTARVNDEGWETVFSEWLRTSHLGPRDGLLIFSVGGGNAAENISVNLVRALELAQEVGAAVFGIVGRNGGYTAKIANACVIVPALEPSRVTPHTEGLAAVVWHLLVSHPALKRAATKWESTK